MHKKIFNCLVFGCVFGGIAYGCFQLKVGYFLPVIFFILLGIYILIGFFTGVLGKNQKKNSLELCNSKNVQEDSSDVKVELEVSFDKEKFKKHMPLKEVSYTQVYNLNELRKSSSSGV